MISRFARLHPPAPRRLTPSERLALRFGEAILTVAVAIGASTLHSPGEFIAGLGYCLLLLEIERWERAGRG